MYPMNGNQFLVTAQVSIVDLILKQPLVSDLHKSANKQDQSDYEQILKTAAVLYVSGPSEPYAVHE